MRRAYISGPILGTANPQAVFRAAVAAWGDLSYPEVILINPMEISPQTCDGECLLLPATANNPHANEHAYMCHMRADAAELALCDTIVMIPGWENSRGARLEMAIAVLLGMDVIFIDEQAFVNALTKELER